MIRQDLGDPILASRLASLPPDGLLRFTLLGGTIRGALVSGTTMVAALRANHGLGILETLALGQAYLTAALASVTLKDGGKLVLRVDCTGALKGFSVEAAWDGRVRGFLFNDSIVLDRPLDSFDLAPFIGKGTLSATRFSPDGEPFTGHIELVHGRIAEDVTEYFLRSEQTRTAFSVGIRFDPQGQVAGAGGLFLQAMPGAAEQDVEDAEFRLSELPSLGSYFSEGRTAGAFLSEWFAAFEPDVMGAAPVEFSCDCSRERFGSYLRALPAGELAALIDEGPDPAEILCHYCGSVYRFGKDELRSIFKA
jgi:molecular chaperone Hsp33